MPEHSAQDPGEHPGPDPGPSRDAGDRGSPGGSPGEVFWVALTLGLRSFGGPVAHLGYFRAEYVERRAWLTDHEYGELIALSSFLPGPSSSQVGAAIGRIRAGLPGALAAWAGFTLPSAIVMGGLGIAASHLEVGDQPWLHALKLVAVAVVLNAVLGMATLLTRTLPAVLIAVATATVLLAGSFSGAVQVACLVVAGLAGTVLFTAAGDPTDEPAPRSPLGPGLIVVGLVMVLAVIGVDVLPSDNPVAAVFAATFRAGAFVFGGGHVVLPLLHPLVVPTLVTEQSFLAGYGLAQAMPGPLFSFGTYLGGAAGGVPGAIVATIGIFLPGLVIMFAVLPLWRRVRRNGTVVAAVAGVNAAVVGVLAAAFADPVVTSSIDDLVDVAVAAGLFVLLRFAKVPAWAIVLIGLAATPLL